MEPTKAIISKHEQKMFLPHDDKVKGLIPGAWEKAGRKGEYMSVPHTVELSRLCRNLGYQVPAPITHWYKWHDNPEPFRVQKITAALMTTSSRKESSRMFLSLPRCQHYLLYGTVRFFSILVTSRQPFSTVAVENELRTFVRDITVTSSTTTAWAQSYLNLWTNDSTLSLLTKLEPTGTSKLIDGKRWMSWQEVTEALSIFGR
jgi:hypothetical protein